MNGFDLYLCHLLAVWLLSKIVHLSFFICKIRIKIIPTCKAIVMVKYDNLCKVIFFIMLDKLWALLHLLLHLSLNGQSWHSISTLWLISGVKRGEKYLTGKKILLNDYLFNEFQNIKYQILNSSKFPLAYLELANHRPQGKIRVMTIDD